jgi:hypothetical protein
MEKKAEQSRFASSRWFWFGLGLSRRRDGEASSKASSTFGTYYLG